MWERYGKAVVEERTNPRHLAEIARYLQWEHGPGTGPAYLLAELADGRRRSRRRPGAALGRAVRAVAVAMISLVARGNRPPATDNPELTR